ncbi:hypothetical protein [Rhodococcus chondri]|uniref:Integral membrane protein n=1 Tax=Rhodococcus chondri TaxID=3065941 RepID=A0ABU7JWB1_9NOCA|nr:hypothetical protein [Rhodococcus sp. CC-R104]MEE2034316.1 hypothetical protein [Rhodococcus sp. CC-R104]
MVALVLVAMQVAVRGVLAAGGEFYWDDLILVGRAGTYPLLSGDILGYDHDGHLMPGAFVVAEAITALAPLQWWPAAVTLVVGQALASLAVLRVLWLLLGPRPAVWAPLLFYLLSPLTLPAYSWWAAGLNALPLQAALAWVAGDALLLARTGRRRYVLTGTVVTVCALLFFEKSVLVPFVAFATLALTYRVDGIDRPVRAASRHGAALWCASGAVLLLWATIYVGTVESRFGVPPWSMVAGLTHHGLSYGLVPTLLGGPWHWDRWNPSPPWADPPALLVVAGWLAVAGALVWSLRRRTRTGPVWIAAAAYVSASLVAMIATRFGPETTYELAQTLRYFADSAVVVAIAIALILRAPARAEAPVPRWHRPVAVGCAAVFATGSLWSTFTFARSWYDNPTGDYLATATSSLTAHPDVPVLDHPVSVWVLLPFTHPHNLVGSVFSALPGGPDIADTATELRVLDEQGRLVPAELLPLRTLLPGDTPDCGHLLVAGATVAVPLEQPAGDWEWTVQLNYRAGGDGVLDIGFPGNPRVRVPVGAGLGSVYVRVSGGGEALQVASSTPGPSVCLGGGPMGVVVPS